MKEITDIDLISKGDIITVLNWKTRNDRSYIGDLFGVKAVDGPFVVVVGLRKFMQDMDIILDSREIVFAWPSPVYVNSLYPSRP